MICDTSSDSHVSPASWWTCISCYDAYTGYRMYWTRQIRIWFSSWSTSRTSSYEKMFTILSSKAKQRKKKKKSTGNALTCALRLRVMESWLLSDFAFLGVTCPSKPGSQDGRLTAGMAPAPGGEFCMVSCNQAVVIVRSWADDSYRSWKADKLVKIYFIER